MKGPAGRIVESVRAAKARHEARHRPAGFEIATAERIDHLNPAHWDAATAGSSILTSRRFLAALDDAPPEGMRTRYALAYRAGAPVAAVSMQTVLLGAEALKREGRAWRRFVKSRVLVCGNLLVWGRHGATFAPGVPASEAWPAVAEALYRVRRADKLEGESDLVLVQDLSDADAGEVGSLETYGYRPFETEPDMVLDLPESCRTLDDYLALHRAKYRKAARGVMKDVASAGWRAEPLADVAAASERLHTLYLDVHRGASVRLFTLSPAYLPRVAAALGDDFRCTALVRDGGAAGLPFEPRAIGGFVTVIRDGTTAVAWFLGFDRAVNETAPLYFRLLYAAVETALAMGCRRITFGRTALEPKARLGAEPVRLRCWVRHRVPLVNLAIRSLLREVSHAEAPDRSPFKD